MMGLSVAGFVRATGLHRVLLAALLGVAFASGSPGTAGSDAPGAAAYLAAGAVAVLLAVALGAIRIRRHFSGRSAAVRSLVTVSGGAAGAGAVVLLLAAGSWPGALVTLVALGIEVVFFLPPLTLGTRVPAEVDMTFIDGILVPAIAGAALGDGWRVPVAVLPVTVLISVSLAFAATVQGRDRPVVGHDRAAGPFSSFVMSIVALAALSGALAVVLSGGGPGLEPELALLASPVSVMAVVFGWLALADKRAEWRYRRVECLVTAGGFALTLGLAAVVLAA